MIYMIYTRDFYLLIDVTPPACFIIYLSLKYNINHLVLNLDQRKTQGSFPTYNSFEPINFQR